MKGKLFLKLLVVILFTIFIHATSVTLVQAAPNIFSGPVSQYKFKAAASWMVGKINLSYYNDGSADKFALMYGTKQGIYKFGALNLPATPNTVNKFTVGYLASDKIYYFVLVAEKNGQFVYMTSPVAAITN